MTGTNQPAFLNEGIVDYALDIYPKLIGINSVLKGPGLARTHRKILENDQKKILGQTNFAII